MLAQIISILGMVAFVISYQFKSKSSVIFSQMIGCALFAVSMFMLGGITGGLLNVVGIVRAAVFIALERTKLSKMPFNILFFVLYWVSYVLTFTVFKMEPIAKNFIVELFPVFAMTAQAVGFSMKKAKHIRLCGFVSSPCFMTYNIFTRSIGGMICESFSLVSIVVGLIKYDLKKKPDANAVETAQGVQDAQEPQDDRESQDLLM